MDPSVNPMHLVQGTRRQIEFGTGFLPPETGPPKGARRRRLRAETGNRRPPHARNGRKNGFSASELSVAGFGRLGGGDQMDRDWMPNIQSIERVSGRSQEREFSMQRQGDKISDLTRIQQQRLRKPKNQGRMSLTSRPYRECLF